MKKIFYKFAVIAVIAVVFVSCKHQLKKDESISESSVKNIDHVLIIYLENHSFHNLFATFPGVDNGLPLGYKGQVDSEGNIYNFLPQAKDRHATKGDSRFPEKPENKPFAIDHYAKQNELVPDAIHEFYTHQVQVNNGLNDKYVAHSAVGALAVGYYDMSQSYLWKLAHEYVLADNFYASAFGGSFLNHQWLIAARTPVYADAPDKIKMVIGANGLPAKSGSLTPDGFAVNSIQPGADPYQEVDSKRQGRLPLLEYPNIGDRLTEKNISWAWYAGGWNDIHAGKNERMF